MKFYQFAFKNLLRSKTRTILTVLSITITTITLFIVLSLDKGFDRSVKEELVESVGAHLFVARGGCPMDAASIIAQGGISPLYVPEDILDSLKRVKGIKDILPFKIFSITTPDGSRTDIFCGVTEQVESIKPRWKYGKGGWFKDENSVILGADIAVIEQRQIGDKIYIEHFDKEFIVSGILEYAYNQDDGMFFLPLITAQKLIRREGKLSAISLSVNDINSLKDIEHKIMEQLPDEYMVLRPESIGESVMSFFNSTKIIMYAVLFFTLLVSVVGIANTMIMMVYERRKELAYLKCVGASSSDICKLIFEETLMICGIGGIAGIVTGLSLSGIFENIVRSFLLTDFLSRSSNIIRPSIDLACVSLLIVMAVGLLAAIYPAFRISSIMPMEAIRNE